MSETTEIRKAQITTISLHNISLPVFVDENGTFSFTWDEEHVESETLGGLRAFLKDKFDASQVEVPFVSVSGNRGVIRGIHKGNRDLLITMADGTKQRLSPWSRVFTDLPEETIAEIKALMERASEIADQLEKIREDTVHASDLYFEKLGENLFDWKRDPDVSEVTFG
jgi:hypothetical protein